MESFVFNARLSLLTLGAFLWPRLSNEGLLAGVNVFPVVDLGRKPGRESLVLTKSRLSTKRPGTEVGGFRGPGAEK